MGYTHYWRRPRNARPKEFESWAQDVTRLIDSGLYDFALCGGDGKGLPEVDHACVDFNGDAEMGQDCENFLVMRNVKPHPHQEIDSRGHFLDFCKTNREPYDLLVCAALIRLAVHFPAWPIESDGSSAEWGPAIRLCERVFEEETFLPDGVPYHGCQFCPSGTAMHAGSYLPGGTWTELCDECFRSMALDPRRA